MESPQKRHKLSPDEKGVPFSKDNQPTPEQKSAGWAKKKVLKELLNIAISANDDMSIKAREQLAKLLGLEPDDLKTMTFEEVMDLRQIQRAFNDTRAWKAIKETVYGQKHEITGPIKIKVNIQK